MTLSLSISAPKQKRKHCHFTKFPVSIGDREVASRICQAKLLLALSSEENFSSPFLIRFGTPFIPEYRGSKLNTHSSAGLQLKLHISHIYKGLVVVMKPLNDNQYAWI